MLKYYDYAITFSEFPDEIALCLNISNCPCCCEGCSESYLKEDVGKELTTNLIDQLMIKYKDYGITIIGFMGGDADHIEVAHLCTYIKSTYNLKVGMYSGFDFIDLKLANILDYYKIGKFILPKGDPTTWHKKTCGSINFPWSNQKMYKRVNTNLIDITERFREQPLNELTKYIIS